MTQPDLFTAPVRTPGSGTRTARVLTYLRARSGEWVDGLTLAQIGGAYAWRTRVSEARAIARTAGADIQNRQRTAAGGATVSEYRYIATRVSA